MTAQILIPEQVESLAPFVNAGILDATEVHAATTFARVSGETSEQVLLAAALAVRAHRLGHVCVDLATIAATVVSSIDSPAESNLASQLSANAVAVDLAALPWPDPDMWTAALSESLLVAKVPEFTGELDDSDSSENGAVARGGLKPLILDGGRLYLSRYWYQERYVAADLVHRSSLESNAPNTGNLAADPMVAAESHIRRLFGSEPDGDQLAASLAGLRRGLVVISGGPGTGKTTTVARFLAGFISGLDEQGVHSQIALAAPTGKAAARMTESIRGAIGALGSELSDSVVQTLQEVEATTIHRLLGRQGAVGFRHGPENPLKHDLVIVDEVSMVSLSLMAHLLSAIRPDAKVVLVGDPYQLASVEAGVVLGDMVGLYGATVDRSASENRDLDGPVAPAAVRQSVRTLRTVHRQASGSPILKLADAVRTGDTGGVLSLLRGGLDEVRWVAIPDGHTSDPSGQSPDRAGLAEVQALVVDAAVDVVRAAADGDVDTAIAGIGRTKVLCGQRVGPSGVAAWNKLVEDELRARGLINWDQFYVGRPVMITENDYLNNVFNGDVGVSLSGGGHFQVWFPGHDQNRMIEAARLDRVATQWAMTIHKSQGSEFPHVIVSLPPSTSRVLTRELIYTAVTRAKSRLTIIASEEAVVASVERPVTRSTGLSERLERAGVDRRSLFVSPD